MKYFFLNIKYLLYTLLTMISLTFSFLAYANAKAILEIVPTSTTVRSITLAKTGTTTLVYTVTNNTNVTVNNITIDPYYGISKKPLTLTVQNNSCAGNLLPGATCSFGLLIQGNGQTETTTLIPRLCTFSGATCSIPILSNRVMITTGGTGTSIAYVVNASGPGLVSICPINNDGSLGTCTTTDGNGTFNTPFGISINAQGTAAYLANSGNNTVSICSIIQDGTGSLDNCITSNGNGTFDYPIGISLNPAGTYLYVANNGAIIPTISICPVIQTGSNFSLGTCTTTTGNGTFGGGFGLQGISFNADGTYAYAPANTWVSICPVLQDGSGNFGSCQKTFGNGTFINPQGVSFNSANTYAYVGNYIINQHSGTVSVCPVLQDGSGNFGTCTTSDGNGTFDFFFNDEVTLYMSSPTQYGYIPNDGNNTVSICPINPTTNNLDFCTTSNGNGTFNQPTAVSLSYVIK